MASLEHGHGRAQPGQLEGGAQPADPGADHAGVDVDVLLQGRPQSVSGALKPE